MPQMRLTSLGRTRLYLRRDMQAGDLVDIEPSCLEAAKELGFVVDPDAEQEPEPPAPRRPRGRPRKAQAEPIEEMTVADLRAAAEEKGVALPAGYVRKDELLEILQDAESDQGDEPPASTES